MSMNDTPRSERVQIAFFGRRNVGKSSLVNAVTGQEMSLVSEVKGTTTDPVLKSMELLPLGPVVIIDTPGFDDEGSLGELRVKKTREILNRTDLAVLAIEASKGLTSWDQELLKLFREKQIPCLLAATKSDTKEEAASPLPRAGEAVLRVSAHSGENIRELKETLARLGEGVLKERPLISDLISPMDLVILVIPIDFAAPKGRLILPQVQVLRDALDHGARALCVRESELSETLSGLLEKGDTPRLVITDSQAFGAVSEIVPQEIYLTSFSILMARYKGVLPSQLAGVSALDDLKDGDKLLISEGCSHHRQCGDIGTVKLPAWIRAYTKKELCFETSSGLSFPENLSDYAMVVHCGGCMLNEKEMASRNRSAILQGVKISNYGMVIAKVHGILDRALLPLQGTY